MGRSTPTTVSAPAPPWYQKLAARCCAYASSIVRASKPTINTGSGGSSPVRRVGSWTPSSAASSPSARLMQLAGCRAMTSSIESPTRQALAAPILVGIRPARSDSADACQIRNRTGQ
eukprot:1012936-Pleurochrysis_carterae.AAC.1